MSLRMGGFTCDNCVIFKQYDGSKHNGLLTISYKIPYNWNLYNKKDNNKITHDETYSDGKWFGNNTIAKNILLCDNCSKIFERKLKIKKLQDEISRR